MTDLIHSTVSASASVDNMALWNAVCKTDPAHTKPAKIGGMKITAIAPMYQIQQATEQFGPYGSTWGLRGIDRNFELMDSLKMVIFSAVFFYPGGEFEISTSNSIYIDNAQTKIDKDFCKKMETDVLTKALSKIGFNADVFMGRFDDVRYVSEMTEEFNKPKTISQPKQAELVALMGSFEMPVAHFLKSWKLSSLAELHEASVENAFNWVNGQAQHKQEVINKKAPQQEQQAPDQEQQHQPVMNQEVADTVKKQFIGKRDGVKYITPKQIQELREALEWAKINKMEFCKKAKIYQLGEMTEDRFYAAMDWVFEQAGTVKTEVKKPMNKRVVNTAPQTQYDKRTEQYAAMSEHNQQRA